MFLSDMKKQVSTKRLLEALLHSYIETNDLENIYNGDGTQLITLDEATKFVDGLKEEASPEQVAFESSLDNMMEEFRTHFPPSIGESERGGSWFDLMHSVWNNHVQRELMEKYSNL
jgi:hypothetical protein